MRLNDAGRMVRSVWEGLPDRFSRMELDAFVVMPNHVHGIIVIHGRGEASAMPLHASKERLESDASPLQRHPNGTQPGSLFAIVQNFKSISTRKMNAARGMLGTPTWQRNYHEHIVRNEIDLRRIREYIIGNPALLNFRR
jgi:putative transposase